MRKEQVGHAVWGILTVQAVKIHPVLAVIMFLLFILYELDEEWHLNDYAYEELREYMYGIAAAVAGEAGVGFLLQP